MHSARVYLINYCRLLWKILAGAWIIIEEMEVDEEKKMNHGMST